MGTYGLGLEGWLNFTSLKLLPVNGCEERMELDISLAGNAAAQALRDRFGNKLLM